MLEYNRIFIKKDYFLIELKEFSKSYGTTRAVDTVSFIAPEKSITALAGLNGAGKTTILKAIASFHYGDSGIVFVNGIDTERNPVQNKKQIGFVSESAHFFSDYTVLEYLNFMSSIVRANKTRISEMIRMFSLDDVVSKKIKALSKGYKQRVLFATALLHDPTVLLLDEPTSGLDPRQIVEMRKLIVELGKTKTILISTHIMQEIEALCSNIIILHKGKIIASGTEKELCNISHTATIEDAFLKLTYDSEVTQ